MNSDHGHSIDPDREKRLVAALRRRPQLFERFEAILALSEADNGKRLTADEVEEFLIEEVRKLGNQTMQQWATDAEEAVSAELARKTPGARLRKKNR